MIVKNIKNNKSGIALIFSMLISSIILAIALGVISVAIKEINFNTSAKNTNEAFFAADTGIECALYNDRSSGTTPFSDSGESVNCLLNGSHRKLWGGPTPVPWIFVVDGLGSSSQACVRVMVSRHFDDANDPTKITSTTILSKGYNIGIDNDSSLCYSPTGTNRVERVLEVNY